MGRVTAYKAIRTEAVPKCTILKSPLFEVELYFDEGAINEPIGIAQIDVGDDFHDVSRAHAQGWGGLDSIGRHAGVQGSLEYRVAGGCLSRHRTPPGQTE